MAVEQSGENYSLFLLIGKSGTGKTSSLRNLPLEKTALINAEAKSMLPFKGAKKLKHHWVLKDITKFMSGLDVLIKKDDIEYIVIDSLSFLMSMYETQIITKAPNTMKAWGDYAIFYREMIHKLKTCKKHVVITSHPTEVQDESTMLINQCAMVKGSLKGMVEADFNVVVYTYNSANEDGLIEYKFLVKKTKNTIGWSVKSPLGMFENDILETNDVMEVFKAIQDFSQE
jgi:archaellum biogenesis ATPase FlaH